MACHQITDCISHVSTPPVYWPQLPVLSGGNLDVMVPSESVCGRQRSKTVSSTIMFHCNPSAGVGIPEFMLETDGCQYLFIWHTNAVCGLTWANTVYSHQRFPPGVEFPAQHRKYIHTAPRFQLYRYKDRFSCPTELLTDSRTTTTIQKAEFYLCLGGARQWGRY